MGFQKVDTRAREIAGKEYTLQIFDSSKQIQHPLPKSTRNPVAVTDSKKGKYYQQDIYTNIELGLTPYLPLSEDYVMQEYPMGQGKIIGPWDMGANKLTQDWEDALEGWKATRPNSKDAIRDAVELTNQGTTIGGEIETEAHTLARLLGIILDTGPTVNEFNTHHREEVMQKAYSKHGLDFFTKGAAGAKNIERVENLLVAGFGQETFDIFNDGPESEELIRLTMNMLETAVDEDFVKDVSAYESTSETNEKWYQQRYNESKTKHGDVATEWQNAAKDSYRELIDKWNIEGGHLKDIYRKLDKAHKSPKSKPESAEYAAKQLLSRLIQIQNNSALGGSFIVMAPVDEYTAGYIKVAVDWDKKVPRGVDSKATIKSIKIRSGTVGFQFFNEMVGTAKTPGPWHWLFQAYGAKNTFATHAHMLMAWLLLTGSMTQKELTIIGPAVMQDIANNVGVRSSGRDLVKGEGIKSLIALESIGMVGNAPVVEAVVMLSEKEAATMLFDTVNEVIAGSKIKDEYAALYERAIQSSRRVTDAWKSVLQVGGAFSADENNPQPFGPPYVDKKNLKGIGIPFWMISGREGPTAPMLFKAKETYTADKFTRKGLLNPQTQRVTQWSDITGVHGRKKADIVPGAQRTRNSFFHKAGARARHKFIMGA